MPKRKLSDLNDAPRAHSNDDARFRELQTTRGLSQKFELGVIALSRGLKTARGFERQKLGRREKTAKGPDGKSETLKRLDEEVKVLKELDPTIVAQKYLFKQLLKTKRIAETTPFVKFKESRKISVEGPRSTAEANVTARLFKSNPVQNVFPGIMDGIRSLLGVDSAPEQRKGARGNDIQSKKAKDTKSRDEGKKDASPVLDRGDLGDSDDDEDAQDEVDLEDGESEGEDFSHFDARIASDSDSASEDDASEGGVGLNRSDMSISLSPSPEERDSPPPKKSKAKGSSQSASGPATSTTFLPSLTMGGYWSGSESEAEDVDRAEEAPKRKNRMGQQARRALWEKKFGSGANHIKQQQKDKGRNGRDSGWDVRRGATGGDDLSGKRGYGRHGANAGQSQYGREPSYRGNSGVQKKPQDDKPLHPSWEAARKAKEQKATASFQGKKVVFD